MRYIVAECHPAYAILLDENAELVYAANLHYSVGQTVESPVLMEKEKTSDNRSAIMHTVRRAAATAAACLLIFGAYRLYMGSADRSAGSTIFMSANASVCMEINNKGEVISVKALNENGEALLSGYSYKGKDKATVSDELVELSISYGYISSGDTVSFYIDAPESCVYDSYRTELLGRLGSYPINTDIQKYDSSVQVRSDFTVSTQATSAQPETVANSTQSYSSMTETAETPAADTEAFTNSTVSTPADEQQAESAYPYHDPETYTWQSGEGNENWHGSGDHGYWYEESTDEEENESSTSEDTDQPYNRRHGWSDGYGRYGQDDDDEDICQYSEDYCDTSSESSWNSWFTGWSGYRFYSYCEREEVSECGGTDTCTYDTGRDSYFGCEHGTECVQPEDTTDETEETEKTENMDETE